MDSDESEEDWNPAQKGKGPKKAPAPRAPAAPAPPPMAAVPIKPLPPKPVTTRVPKAAPVGAAPEIDPSELSLGARLANRMAELQLGAVPPLAAAPKAAGTKATGAKAAAAVTKTAAAPKAAAAPRPRKATKAVVLSER